MIATWIAAFLTLSIMSFLWRDNPVFRFAENLFAGISLGSAGYVAGGLVSVWAVAGPTNRAIPKSDARSDSARTQSAPRLGMALPGAP